MAQWADVPFDGKLYQNADEALISENATAVENAFHSETDGYSRFPGYRSFSPIDAERIYLADWKGDLVAVTDKGRTYRIDRNGKATDCTQVVLSGGKRPIFDKTDFELVFAAGGAILALGSLKTRILSTAAPMSTHIAVIDGYAIAIEALSGRFYHSAPGEYTSWDPIDVFTAEAKGDDLNACVVTPYRELLLAGVDSIEQFERSGGGSSRAFFRRWTTGEGIYAPYTLLAFKNGTYGVNPLQEFVRFQAQVSRPESEDISMQLQKITDWEDAWSAGPIHIKGQKFILLQAPHAENAYKTKGVTLLLDYKNRRWSHLYGWDESQSLPTRYPAWSYRRLWGRQFIGVPGGVMELTDDTHAHAGSPQPWRIRTGNITKWGQAARIDDLEVNLKRGVGPQTPAREPTVRIRAIMDRKTRTKWVERGLGSPGDNDLSYCLGPFGTAGTWQFELLCTDDVPIEFRSMRAQVENLHR